MNFISHHHHERLHQSVYYRFGAVFPDLCRPAVPDLKLFPNLQSLLTSSQESQAFIDGIKSHFETDRRFHQSQFFAAQSAIIKEQFKSAKVTSPGFRLFFVSHILTEMILDRVLLNESRAHGEAFYDTLSGIDIDSLHSCFSNIPAYRVQNFNSFFSRFKNSKYLFTYTEDEALFFALNRVCKNVGTGVLESNQLPMFKEIVAHSEAAMQKEYREFFDSF